MRPLTGPRDRTLDAIWYVAAPDDHNKAVADTDTLTFRLIIESGVGHILAALAHTSNTIYCFLIHSIKPTTTHAIFSSASTSPSVCPSRL